MLLALVAFALLRLPAPLIAVAALGLPLLFLIYLQESDALRDLPARTLVLTAALGVALGVGWVLLTGADGRPLLRRPTGCRHRGIPHAA